MDISARAWLIVIGILLIAAVLLDGYRRMRKNNRIDFGKMDPLQEDDFSHELPNGGARVFSRDGEFENDDENYPDKYDSEPVFKAEADAVDANASEHISNKRKIASQSSQDNLSEPSTPKTSVSDSKIDELYIVNVISRDGMEFDPDLLLHCLLDSGLRFGDMDIFHSYSESSSTKIDFSVANAQEPGFFNVDNMGQTLTQGLTFFMALPGPESPLKTYDQMLDCASNIATQIEADLKDTDHNILTSQIIMHDRQQIEEYIRRSFRANIE